MRVEQLGDGDPEVAIVGGIHGDEPCGVRAVETLMAERPSVDRPVKLVVANELAIERGVRYVDEDLNRAFPGDPNAETHEGRLATDLAAEIRGCRVLSLHSTQSHAEPFGVVAEVDGLTRAVYPRLSVESVVVSGPFTSGRLVGYEGVLEVECGLQGSEVAAENATHLAREFLVATGARPADAERAPRELPVYRLTRQIPKARGDTYEVFVDNFERVDVGETFAAADGEQLVADEPFYPVLMSPYGYESVFGYAAELVGTLTVEAQ